MKNNNWRKYVPAFAVYCLVDLVSIGAGMGVPFFAILFGFVVGWFIPSLVVSGPADLRQLLRRCLLASVLASTFTFLCLLALWGPVGAMLFDPGADFANFGTPLILYEPKASFIGWLVLMIVVSPVLQLLAAAFASAIRIAWQTPKQPNPG
jgi:hypothetical protein